MRGFARRFKVFDGDIAGTVRMNDQEFVSGKILRLGFLQPRADLIGLVGIVQHDEQNRLLA